MNRIRPKQSRGFTLVEVAVVLFFMGIFVSFAASMMKNIALSTKLRDARDKLTIVSDAVQAWAVSKREIPSNLASFTSAVGNNSVDYWNKPFAFHSYTTQPGAVRDICRRSSTNLAVCPGGDCSSKIIKDIAYVIISGGDGLTVNNPTRFTASPCSATQLCIPIKDLSATNDDLYKYISLLELKKTVGCVEADSGLRILNPELPSARLNNKYIVPLVADGGQNNLIDPKYSWCVQGVPPTGLSVVDKIGGNVASCSSSYTNATFINISGVPSVSALGTATPLTFKVKDSGGVISTKAFVLNVNP